MADELAARRQAAIQAGAIRESHRDRILRAWHSMTPAQRDYDRYQGKIPVGASWTPETEDGARAIEERQAERGLSLYEAGCTCHISPPCSFCLRMDYDAEDSNG